MSKSKIHKELIMPDVEMINELSNRTSNLIEIINTIDQNIIAGNDNEVQSLVSEYYNGILTQTDQVSENILKLRKQLVYNL